MNIKGHKIEAEVEVVTPVIKATLAKAELPSNSKVNSPTLVANLNADLLDGNHGAYYASTSQLLLRPIFTYFI